jgi:hypothetical protein
MKLFYSYSHKDESLREALEQHLAILRRSGVVESWSDRNIEAGSNWSEAIDNKINQADVILLLISADFLASDYCHEIEMKHALERDRAGDARVIPIILRAVDWSGAEFGHLQALPSGARPVTSWQNADEAFTDIAKGIRRAVEGLRARRVLPQTTVFNTRQIVGFLQAAVPSRVPVGHSRDVVVMITSEDLPHLSDALAQDDTYTSRPGDVKSQRFSLTVEGLPSNPLTIPAMIRLRAPDFEPLEQKIETEFLSDSTTPILPFLVKAKNSGTQLLNVDLLVRDRLAGSRVLRTEAEEKDNPPGGPGAVFAAPPPPTGWTVIASLAMQIAAFAQAHAFRSAGAS